MGSRYKQERWYWPTFGNIADAEQASNQGFWAAAFCAVVTAVVATISVLSSHSIMGINSFAYVDAVLLVIIAWRIRRRSRVFAVIGLALFVAEKIFQFATQPQLLWNLHGRGAAVLLYQRCSRHFCLPSHARDQSTGACRRKRLTCCSVFNKKGLRMRSPFSIRHAGKLRPRSVR